MSSRPKPTYVFAGFLDSGKTWAIKDSLRDETFNYGEKSLIVVFEQGDEEYDQQFLEETNSEVVYYDDLSDLTVDEIEKLDMMYCPERIVIELNGMQDETEIYKPNRLGDWIIVQSITMFDAPALKLQMANMKQFVYNHVINSEAVYINRCPMDMVNYFRNNLKAINPRTQVVFLDENYEIIQNIQSQIFDTSKDLVIDDQDYGLWYIDAVDNPEKYNGVRITLKMKLFDVNMAYQKVCVMGRQVMVCCANDIQDAGITVVGINPDKLNRKDYFSVTGVLSTIDTREGYKTCILNAKTYKKAARPKEDIVSFS